MEKSHTDEQKRGKEKKVFFLKKEEKKNQGFLFKKVEMVSWREHFCLLH